LWHIERLVKKSTVLRNSLPLYLKRNVMGEGRAFSCPGWLAKKSDAETAME